MIFVIARFISRFPRLLGAGFGADDWTVGLCVAPMTGMTVVAYYEYYYGSGRDVWTVPVDNLEPFALVSLFRHSIDKHILTMNSGSSLANHYT